MINLSILIACLLNNVWISQGEVTCWSLALIVDLLTFPLIVDAENVQRELEMLSQSEASSDNKTNSLVPPRGSNGDLQTGHSQSNGVHTSVNPGTKGIVNGLPSKWFTWWTLNWGRKVKSIFVHSTQPELIPVFKLHKITKG